MPPRTEVLDAGDNIEATFSAPVLVEKPEVAIEVVAEENRYTPIEHNIAEDMAKHEARTISSALSSHIMDDIQRVLDRPAEADVDGLAQRLHEAINASSLKGAAGSSSPAEIMASLQSVVDEAPIHNAEDITKRLNEAISLTLLGDSEVLKEGKLPEGVDTFRNPRQISENTLKTAGNKLQSDTEIASKLAASIVINLTTAMEAKRVYAPDVDYKSQYNANRVELDSICSAALADILASGMAETYQDEVKAVVAWGAERMDAEALEKYFVKQPETAVRAAEALDEKRKLSDMIYAEDLLARQKPEMDAIAAKWREDNNKPETEMPPRAYLEDTWEAAHWDAIRQIGIETVDLNPLHDSQKQDLADSLAAWRLENGKPETYRPTSSEVETTWTEKYGSSLEQIPSLETRFQQLAVLKERAERLEAAYPDAPKMKLANVNYDEILKLMPPFDPEDKSTGHITQVYKSEMDKYYPDCEVLFDGGPESKVMPDERLMFKMRGGESLNGPSVRHQRSVYGDLSSRQGQYGEFGLMLFDEVVTDAESGAVVQPRYTRQELIGMADATGVDCLAEMPEGLAWIIQNKPQAGESVDFPSHIDADDNYCGVDITRRNPNDPNYLSLRLMFMVRTNPEPETEPGAESKIPTKNCIRVVHA